MAKYGYIFLCLSICGCQESAQNEKIGLKEQINNEWLYSAEPDADFDAAIKNSDFRFYGVYGYSVSAPGISRKCLEYSKDIRLIEGTSDATSNYEEEKFNAIARVYARRYNAYMKMYLEINQGFVCDAAIEAFP